MSDGHLSRDTLERLARRELSPREATDARRHIDECEECAALLEAPAAPARWGMLAAAAAAVMAAVLVLVAVRQCPP